jgi:predicted CXXCH cytochrome family protein
MFSGMKKVHGPVGSGLCASCHNPHASPEKKLLVDIMPNICFKCHSKSNFNGQKIKHAPVAGGMCTDCHAPHQSNEKRLLLKKVPEICFNCHGEQGFINRNSHPPVTSGMCMVCHEPHASDTMWLLMKDVNTGCLECHPRISQEPHAVSGFQKTGHPLESKRKIVIDGKKSRLNCAGCHNPHGSSGQRLLRNQSGDFFSLCKNCHEK